MPGLDKSVRPWCTWNYKRYYHYFYFYFIIIFNNYARKHTFSVYPVHEATLKN